MKQELISTFGWWASKATTTDVGCWIPHRPASMSHPYKLVRIHNTLERVYLHRLSWMVSNGKRIPTGPRFVTRHVCSNSHCFNPQHLVIGTKQENEADKCRINRPITTNTEAWEGL